MTGLALATAVGGAGYRVLVVERAPLTQLTSAPYDGRVTAVARGGRRFLEEIGAWAGMADGRPPILDIVVREAFSPIQVHYDHRRWARSRSATLSRTGRSAGLIERPHCRGALAAPAEIAALERRRRGSMSGSPTAAGPPRRCWPCARAASRARASGWALRPRQWSYGQTGIVCSFAHERPHHGLAVERFFPDGPFARLPMTGDRSSIVWAWTMPSRDRARPGRYGLPGRGRGPLRRRPGPSWRSQPPLVLSFGPGYGPPLHRPPAALVGDAARGIHPIAGQGWNLALRDVAAVAEIVVDRLRLGLDPGDALALERYAAWRRFDGLALVGGHRRDQSPVRQRFFYRCAWRARPGLPPFSGCRRSSASSCSTPWAWSATCRGRCAGSRCDKESGAPREGAPIVREEG